MYTDPRADTVWRHDGAWWAPLVRRPWLGAAWLGVASVVVTLLMAEIKGLPVRDADGIFGKRMLILLGTVAGFFALETLPRAFRVWRSERSGPRSALRVVLADRWSRRRVRVAAIGIVSFYATYISYRNIKSYLPFYVPQDRDAQLLDVDRWIFGGHDPAQLLHSLLGTGIAAHVLSFVYLFYLAFIPISLGAALILAANPVPGMWWVTTLGINWILGALSYFVIPSLGPAFFDPQLVAGLPHTGVASLQQTLWVERAQVLADPHATHAVQSIAAFASLHTSVVFSAVIMAYVIRVPVLLRRALWVFLVLVVLSTMYFGWHYILDDVAGLVIGALAVVGGAAATGHWNVLWEWVQDRRGVRWSSAVS